MPHKRKKKGGKKSKRSGEGRKQKVKEESAAKLSRKKTVEILLSAHARTLKAVIWHQEQKLVQCSTCKQRFGQFGFFSARQRPKNGLTRFERHFLAKCPGVNGLIKLTSCSNSFSGILQTPAVILNFRKNVSRLVTTGAINVKKKPSEGDTLSCYESLLPKSRC